jgi:hypothetical protein
LVVSEVVPEVVADLAEAVVACPVAEVQAEVGEN